METAYEKNIKSTSKTKSELVIMITPKILNDGEGTIADTL